MQKGRDEVVNMVLTRAGWVGVRLWQRKQIISVARNRELQRFYPVSRTPQL